MTSEIEAAIPVREDSSQDLLLLLESWKGSIAEFARQQGTSPQHIYNLRSKLRKQTRAGSGSSQPQGVELDDGLGFARASVELTPAELGPVSQKPCERLLTESEAPARIQLGGSLVIELSHAPSAKFVAELAGRMQCKG